MSTDPLTPGSPSESLIRRAQAADPAALEKLTHLYGPVVFTWARRAGLHSQDAADVMQDVFHVLLTKLPSYQRRDGSDSFRGWLYVITRNKVRDFFRRCPPGTLGQGGSTAMQLWQQLPDAAPTAESRDGQSEISSVRRRALELVRSEFAPQTWLAFWRTVVESDAAQDVATDLGVSVWAVYKARSRVLARLRHEFAELL